MKLTIKQYDKEVICENSENEDLNLCQVIEQLFRPALLEIGFTENTIKKYLGSVNKLGLIKGSCFDIDPDLFNRKIKELKLDGSWEIDDITNKINEIINAVNRLL